MPQKALRPGARWSERTGREMQSWEQACEKEDATKPLENQLRLTFKGCQKMSILSNWNGSDTRKDIRRGMAEVRTGRDNALGGYQDAYDSAQAFLAPYQDNGRAMNFYDSLLYGDPNSSEIVMGNPMFSGALQQEQNATLANMNARGMGGSGAAALAAARVNNEDAYRRLGLYRDRAQMGGQYAGMGANLATGLGQQQGNAWMGAANALNQGHQQIGQTRSMGLNNTLGALGAVGKIAAIPMTGGGSLGGNFLGSFMG